MANIVVKGEVLILMFLSDLYFSVPLLSPSAAKLCHYIYNDHITLNDFLNLQFCNRAVRINRFFFLNIVR